MADSVAATFAAMSAMFAVYDRDHHGGVGQEIDVSLYEPLSRLVESQVIGYDQLGIVKQRMGNRLAEDSPRNTYQMRNGQWISISASSQRTYERLVEAMGMPELIVDPRFKTNESRCVNDVALDELLAAWFVKRDLSDIMYLFEHAGVVAGQAPYSKRSEDSVHRLLYKAGTAALADAGLSWQAVNGLAVTSFRLPPDNVAVVAEHFGVEARFLFQGVYGGASGIIGMAHAARAIRDGACDVVVCAAADAFDVASHNETLDHLNSSVRDYMSPVGFGGANGMFALHIRLYMDRYGATHEDFGRFCISLRENALLNPNALFKSPLSMAEYLNARLIADPLRLYDCVMPCIGGDAIVLVSEKIARTLPGPSLKILATEELHNYPAKTVYELPGSWEGFADKLYHTAACSPRDLDFIQVYDDYPVMSFIQLEGLQLCKPGEAGRLVRERGITVRGGGIPVNTGGGQLSAGQAGASGGMIGVVEDVTQLLGRAGGRQITCRRGLVSGYGMVAYGRGLSSSAAILERVQDGE